MPEGVAYRPASLRAIAPILDDSDLPGADAARPGTLDGFEVHVVQQGDTLRSIAIAKYGREDLFQLAFLANRDKLRDPDSLYRGQGLRLPAMPGSDGLV